METFCFFKKKTAYEIRLSLGGSEMGIRGRAGSSDRVSGDVQLRFDHTQFDLSETAIPPYLPIGLDGLSYATDSTTFGTRRW